jgi:hypothetical protein
MIRFLQILLAFVVVRVLWGFIRSLVKRPADPVPRPRAGRTEERGRVVACARCDLHVPEERAVARDGRTFCSDACAAAGAQG